MKTEDKEQLISKIKSLDGLTEDERYALLGLLKKDKKYGLIWEDKPEEIEERLRTELPVLKEVKSRAILEGGPKAPNHILIEGDNLEALTTLSYTHEGKIDVIYIDPPYNTGNQDFIYNDKYIDADDDYRHSMWLSFMKKRLFIAKKLLTERGVIFISIDDNEAANLKVLLDDKDLFGEKNFAGQFIWHQGRKSMAAQFAVNHEYCLVYCKNRTALLNYDLVTENNNWREKKEGLKEIYEEFDRLSNIYGSDYSSIEQGIRLFFKNLPTDHPSKRQSQYKCVDKGGLYFPGDIAQGTGNGGRFNILHPKTGKPCKLPKGGWRFSENKLPEILQADLIHFGPDENTVPCLKRYLKNTEYEVMSSIFYKDGRGATKRLETILGKKAFDHPKDEEIIAKFIKAMTSYLDNRKYTILDFFAGSGTTLHAVMQLNKDDGGQRQCILCTNNENNICEEVTYERNKRVINGYTKPNDEFVPGLKDNNLRYYKTAFVGRRRTPQNMRRLMLLATDMLCIKENIYTEEKEFEGMPTLENGFRYFNENGQQMLIIYNEESIYPIVEKLEGLTVENPIVVYIFSPGNDPWSEEFATVEGKVKLTALPAAVYNAYKRVVPKPKELLIEPKDEEKTEVINEESGSLFAAEEGGEE